MANHSIGAVAINSLSRKTKKKPRGRLPGAFCVKPAVLYAAVMSKVYYFFSSFFISCFLCAFL